MIRCFLYRQRITARVDADLELQPDVRRHVEDCAPCRRFYDQERSMARGLAAGAAGERLEPSPFFQARVMAALERPTRPAHAQPWLGRWVWTGGLAVALVVVLLRVVHAPVAPKQPVTTADLSVVIKELAALEKRMPDDQKLEQWTGTVDEPLDKEMRSLFHDARSVAQTLVKNFMPGDLARPTTGGNEQ